MALVREVVIGVGRIEEILRKGEDAVDAVESIQPAAGISNFSFSSKLKLLWIIQDRDYPFSAKQLY